MQEKIIDYLKKKYQAKGIILYGSKTTGESVDLSDWDLFIFSDKDADTLDNYAELNEYENENLDITIYPTNVADDLILTTNMHPVTKAMVLYDDLGGKMAKIIENSNEAYDKGPATLTNQQKALQRKILRKFLNKARSRPNDQATTYFGISQYFIFATRYWFELNDLWPLPFYTAMNIIKKQDIEYFNLLTTLYSTGKSNAEKIESMERLYRLIIIYQNRQNNED